MNAIKSIVQKKTGKLSFIGIIKAGDWFGITEKFYNVLTPSDFVVGQWFDFHDGQSSHIEDRVTIAICKNIEDAELIYNEK